MPLTDEERGTALGRPPREWPRPGRRIVWKVTALALLASLGCGQTDAPPEPRILVTGEKAYSNQDVIIRDFFSDMRDGVFVDVGCYDWKKGNNTLYLEESLGWTGVAVDVLDYLRKGYRENRPGTRFFRYAVSDVSGETATFYAQAALTSTNPDQLKHFPGLEHARGPAFEVETTTLTDLLDRAGIEKIDFLNMDIEGSEPKALAGFDIQRFRPELVCIEASEQVRPFLTEYFETHGYERIDEYLEYDAYNWYFRPQPD